MGKIIALILVYTLVTVQVASAIDVLGVVIGSAGGGGGGTEYLYPDGDGGSVAWTSGGTGCTSDWECVDGTTVTYSDADYLTTSSDYATSDVTMSNTSASTGKTITSITVYWRAKSTDSSNGVRFKIKPLSSSYDGPRPTQTTSFAYYSQEWTTNPDDSQPWESTDLDTLQIQAYSLALGGATYDWSHGYVEVTYTD